MERKKQRKVQSLQSQGRPLCPCVRPAYSEGGELVTGAVLFTDKAGCLLPWEKQPFTERLQYQSPADSATQTPDHALSSGGWKPTVKFPVGLFLVPQRPGRSSVPYGHSFQSKSDYGQPGGQALKPCGVRLSMCVPEGPQEPLEAVTSPSPWSSAPGKERFCCRSDPRGSTSQRPCRWRSGLRDSGRGPGSA
ncbi:uncharacterized protein LOC123611967 isoform X5 [Camelus bactrianus]|uniref:Uncharacterized protein LOC123611967 isoform X5 n=1 Tax=Camelus bactrianus TaxID=9837 RepID=A0AC58NUU0_CAMBA